MERQEFIERVRLVAERNLRIQNAELTEQAIQGQMLWLAALAEATEISECWDLKDIAQALMTGGIQPTNFDTWVDNWMDEDQDPGEALDLIRLF